MSVVSKSVAFVVLVALILVPFSLAQTQTKRTQKPQTQKPNPAEPEIDPDDVIRVRTNLVNAPVLVIGRDGKYVPSLKREDFEVYDEGIKQEIAYFAPVEKPFTIALLIDTSHSTVFELRNIQDAAIRFVDSMRTDDQALVISFADEIKVLAEATSDRKQLQDSIRSCRPGGASRVYDAIDFALSERLDRIQGRKALIVLTDGVDNSSRVATFESSLQRIQKTETLVYPVQFSTNESMITRSSRTAPEGSGFTQKDYQLADTYLHQAAEATGTALHPARDIADLESAVAQIVDELHNEYSLGYYPKALGQPGEVRRIEVRVRQPQLTIRTRGGYVVNESGTAANPVKNKSVSPVDRSADGPLPVPRDSEQATVPLGAKWMCKGTDVPTDLVVVKEGFVSQCPKSTRTVDETNAWLLKTPGPTEVMCKGFLQWRGGEVAAAPVPTGYVVTAEVESPVCSKSGDIQNKKNAWKVSLPQLTDTVCKGFVIPRGFVVIGEKDSPSCPAKGGNKKAWRIRAKSQE